MTPTQYLRASARFWWLVVACAVAGIAVPVIVQSSTQPTYSSTVTVLVAGTASSQTGAADAYQSTILAQQRMATYADVASGPTLARDILSEVDTELSSRQLESQIEVVVPPSSSVVRISVEDTDRDRDQLLASAAGRAMVGIVTDLETVRGRSFSLLRARVVADANTPALVSAPPAWRNPALGGAGGLVLGLALAAALSRLDPRVADDESVQAALGAPVMGVLPRPDRRRLGWGGRGPTTAWDAAVRELRTSIFFRHPGPDHCLTVAFTSPRPDDNVRTIVGATATALVDAGAKVLLVDADLRQPHPTPLLGYTGDDEPGLAAHLIGASVEGDLVLHDPQSGVDVLPAGTPMPNPAGLLHSEAFATLLQDAAERFDFVLVTTPATSVGTDAVAVAARCDVSLVTVVRHRTRWTHLTRTRRQLERVEADIVGAVLLT